MEDKFSTLSEQLTYHVLSFLSLEDLGRLMLVSKRCNSLCVSVPCLTIDNRNYTHNLISRQRFNQFVQKFLDLRRNSGIKTPCCTLVWSFQGTRCDQNKKRKKGDESCLTEEFLFCKWLLGYLGNARIESLSVNVVPQERQTIKILPYAFWCKSLKDLTFCSNNYLLAFPLDFNIKLESLTIQSTRFSNHKVLTEGIRGLRYLKSLYLYDCTGLKSMFIKSESLEQLKIISGKHVDLRHLNLAVTNLKKLFLAWYPSVFSKATFEICCSALQDFVWFGYPAHFDDFSHFSKPVSAAICLTLPPGSNVEAFSYFQMQITLSHVGKFVKFLRLHGETIEILFKLGQSMTQLDALRTLAIDYCVLTDNQVPRIVSFLKTVPYLESFTLTSSTTIGRGSFQDGLLKVRPEGFGLKVGLPPEGFGFDVEYWESQELKFIDQLREATVEVLKEEGNDMELVKYLLKHARGLKCLTIVCAPSLASSLAGRLNLFMKAPTKLNFCAHVMPCQLGAGVYC